MSDIISYTYVLTILATKKNNFTKTWFEIQNALKHVMQQKCVGMTVSELVISRRAGVPRDT